MIDTVHFFVEHDRINISISEIQTKLTLSNGKWYNGNFLIKFNQNNIMVMGSLSTYYLGSNQHFLTREEIYNAIYKLSNATGLPLFDSIITRLDIAMNFPINIPVDSFLHQLGELNARYQRIQTAKTTLEYRNRTKSIIFYDKIAEVKQAKRNKNLRPIYSDKNLLRYEVRFKKKIDKSLKETSKITGIRLSQPDFYIKLKNEYINIYNSIKKINKPLLNNLNNINFNNITTVKYSIDTLLGVLIHNIPADIQKQVLNLYIGLLKQHNCFKHQSYYSLLRNKLVTIQNNTLISKQIPTIKTLNKTFNNVIRHLR